MQLNQRGHTELLRQADQAVGVAAETAKLDPHRLRYHIMAQANWINDPNGLIQFNGEYHVFYQHHPYSAEWGPMHWGHMKSEDLVNWQHLPIALAPNQAYDKDGCFSGSAVEHDGKLYLIYTGHVDDHSPKEVQCVAVSEDGVHFEKFEGNPVVAAPPVDGSEDFRDPKVWKHEDKWYMVVGTGKDRVGKAVLYSSADLLDWKYEGVMAESNGSQGVMWECPDLFKLGAHHVLICSPMEMEDAKTLYIVGDLSYKSKRFTQKHYQELDLGLDFYAPQTFQDDKGRRILIGWMDMWGGEIPTQSYQWAGAMTLPRELKLLDDGRMSQTPVEELKKLRRKKYQFEDLLVKEGEASYLSDIKGETLEIIVTFDLSKSESTAFGLKLRCSDDGSEETLVFYDKVEKEVVVNRSKGGKGPQASCKAKVVASNDEITLHVFLDTSSVEVFSDGGRIAMSNRIYPDPDSRGVDVFADNGFALVKGLMVYPLN